MGSSNLISNLSKAKELYRHTNASQRRRALGILIETLLHDKATILNANKKDVKLAENKYDEAFTDRMTLNDERFEAIIASVEQVMNLPDIVGRQYDEARQRSGIVTSKIKIPLGAILMIYESRPNVTIDAVALSIKTANAIILKGGSEIKYTNEIFGQSILNALKKSEIFEGSVQILSTNSRSLTSDLLARDECIDLVIPRGSRRLLEFVQKNSKIPILMHLEGNCHIYVDMYADLDIAKKVIIDSKTQRVGTCNAAESLIIHKAIAKKFIPAIVKFLREKNIEVRGDEYVSKLIKDIKTAQKEDWGKEYLAPVISVKVVDSIEKAIDHVNRHGSGHTDSIITIDQDSAKKFISQVDSSSVMLNTSTRFADGFEYGLGAEIGISTNKLHARGPVGQEGLLTYKWVVQSNGKTKGDIVVEGK